MIEKGHGLSVAFSVYSLFCSLQIHTLLKDPQNRRNYSKDYQKDIELA